MEIGESISFKFLHLFAADNKIQELERNLNCSQSSISCKLPAQIAQNSKTKPLNSLCVQLIKIKILGLWSLKVLLLEKVDLILQ